MRCCAIRIRLVPTAVLLVSSVMFGLGGAKGLQVEDVFQLEMALDPQISPDGRQVVYARTSMDFMTDRAASHLWTIQTDGEDHRPLTSGKANCFSHRWSPDGSRLAYLSGEEGKAQIYLQWLKTGQTARLTNVDGSLEGIAWSPDGRWIAFSMLVKEEPKPYAEMPMPPEGATWAKPPRVIRNLLYRADGKGYLEEGFYHLFVISAEGGTPRQLTDGDFHHRGTPSWAPDGRSLVFSANRSPDWEHDPLNSEIYEVSLSDAKIRQWTRRQGPDSDPVVSPDGKYIAYLGFDDRYQGYQVTRLYLMNRSTGEIRPLTEGLDRTVEQPLWGGDSQKVFFQYSDEGNTRLARIGLDGELEVLAYDLGGTSLGRPYGGGSFSVSSEGVFAYTRTRPEHPSDVAVGTGEQQGSRRITHLNDDLLGQRELGAVEELWWKSSFDGRRIHGWLVKPPAFDSGRKYPLILEIHGGPFADYGDRFSAEMQLYAAAGYVVLYANPRGSTSYGEEFGNLIHHNYPGEDYDDLMSGVDSVIGLGFVDPQRLYVTGGSGGGVLTSWIVGKTDRFKAAVVAKPVINWYSFVLTADSYNFFYRYWFPGFPWDHQEHYMKRSPISLVGNVKTPTMLLTGEVDYRTPISESEQYYQALKLRKVDSVLVRIPEASHGIADRPSQLIAKVSHILKWFETHP